MASNEVQDALYAATEGADTDYVRGRVLAFVHELPEDMTVQEIVESLKVGGDEEDDT